LNNWPTADAAPAPDGTDTRLARQAVSIATGRAVAILAIVAGANSYRTIHSFIDVHLAQLRDAFGVKWRKAPAYTTIRGILRQLDPASVEAVFRRHAAILNDAAEIQSRRHLAIDGKTLRRSFDFLDRRAALFIGKSNRQCEQR
jgi:hypothetical protein